MFPLPSHGPGCFGNLRVQVESVELNVGLSGGFGLNFKWIFIFDFALHLQFALHTIVSSSFLPVFWGSLSLLYFPPCFCWFTFTLFVLRGRVFLLIFLLLFKHTHFHCCLHCLCLFVFVLFCLRSMSNPGVSSSPAAFLRSILAGDGEFLVSTRVLSLVLAFA